jgi:hypothetical protein
MIMMTTKSLAAASLALVLLAACGSSGMGDILGGGSNPSNYEIRGTVDSVDLNSRSIYLTNVSGYSSMLSNGGGNAVRVYYDDRTPVDYNGQSYRPSDLERGDQVSVRVDESGNTLMAESLTVTRDASSNSSSYPGSSSGSYESSLRGTVRYIDTARRTIEVDRGTGSVSIVEFDTNTPVYFNSQTYNPSDLDAAMRSTSVSATSATAAMSRRTSPSFAASARTGPPAAAAAAVLRRRRRSAAP